VSVNSLDWGGAATITPNEESIKEVRVTANSYDAQFGRTSGAQVEVVSQNGTNQYHGSLFLKIDRPGLNAFQRNFGLGTAADQRATNRFNQYGGSVGGPIIKNRLFAFFSYETLKNICALLVCCTLRITGNSFCSAAGASCRRKRFLSRLRQSDL